MLLSEDEDFGITITVNVLLAADARLPKVRADQAIVSEKFLSAMAVNKRSEEVS